MTLHRDLWNQALRLKATLLALGVQDGEIAFPAGGEAGTACWVSETLGESPELTPSMIRVLQGGIQAAQCALEGYSVRLQAGHFSLQEGDSGGFLMAWDLEGTFEEADLGEAVEFC